MNSSTKGSSDSSLLERLFSREIVGIQHPASESQKSNLANMIKFLVTPVNKNQVPS